MSEAAYLLMEQNWSWVTQAADKKINYWVASISDTYVILGSELELKNSKKFKQLYQNIFEFSQKLGEEGKSANVSVKLISSETIIVYLVYWNCR